MSSNSAVLTTKFTNMELKRGQLLLLHICSWLLLSEVFALSFKKSYEVSQVAVINKPGKLFESELRMIGRERVLNGTFTIRQDLDDDFMFVIKVFSDGNRNGEYSEMPLQFPKLGICVTFKKFYKTFAEASFKLDVNTDFNFMNGNVCPIPKGKYWIKNVLFNSDDWINVLPYGNMKVDLSLMQNDEFMGGFDLIFNIEQKRFK